jgi:cyclohexa-1,5-dienecarbonyl-CoA hydratase
MPTREYATLAATGDMARLTLRRPPLNFLHTEMLRQIQEHLFSLGESPDCRALVLESEVGAFCAGLDMTQHTPDTLFLLLEEFHAVVQALNSFPRPTIALVNGMALGAGNEILAFCDFVIASEKASFGQPEINVGSIPSLAHIALPGLIGQRRTTEMILTGKLLPAAEAQRIGLIHRSVPEGKVDTALEEQMKVIRGLSKAVMGLALQAARRSRTRELEANLREAESLYLNQLMDLEDAAEGVKAFLEKRPPKWKHR